MSSSTSLLRVSGGASTSAPSAIVDVVGAVGGASRRSLRRTTALSLRRRPTPTLLRFVAVAASGTNDDRASLSSSPFGGGLDPSLELAVPKDQRPSNELASLKTAPLYSWVSVRRERGWKRENIVADALFLLSSLSLKLNPHQNKNKNLLLSSHKKATLPASDLALRLAALGFVSFLLLSGPISAGTYDPRTQTLEFALASLVGSLLVVGGVGVRLFLGWSYVSTRLMSAAVPYEETGWYDGQTFVKPPAVLARDRLLGSYEARPALNRVRGALAAAAAALVAASVSLVVVSSTSGASNAAVAPPSPLRIASDGSGIIYSKNLALEDSLAALASDDDAAELEAEAMLGRPGYCGDRIYRARAGGNAAACDAPARGEGLKAVEAARAKLARGEGGGGGGS